MPRSVSLERAFFIFHQVRTGLLNQFVGQTCYSNSFALRRPRLGLDRLAEEPLRRFARPHDLTLHHDLPLRLLRLFRRGARRGAASIVRVLRKRQVALGKKLIHFLSSRKHGRPPSMTRLFNVPRWTVYMTAKALQRLQKKKLFGIPRLFLRYTPSRKYTTNPSPDYTCIFKPSYAACT